MKVTSLNVLLAGSFIFSQMTVSSALKCGQWNTHACLGDTDNRYDPDYTNDIKKQDELWEKMDGFYRVTQTSSSQPARFNPYDFQKYFSMKKIYLLLPMRMLNLDQREWAIREYA